MAPYEESGSITPEMLNGVYDVMIDPNAGPLQPTTLLVPPSLNQTAQELLNGGPGIVRSELDERYSAQMAQSMITGMTAMGDSARRIIERAVDDIFNTRVNAHLTSPTAWYLAPEHDTNIVWEYRGGTPA